MVRMAGTYTEAGPCRMGKRRVVAGQKYLTVQRPLDTEQVMDPWTKAPMRDEPFDTTADGAAVIEHPDPGEVVWCDDAGVTCRWNWRQAQRTALP